MKFTWEKVILLTLMCLIISCTKSANVEVIDINESDINSFDRVYSRGWDDAELAQIKVNPNFTGRIKIHYYDSNKIQTFILDNDSYDELTAELRVLNPHTDDINTDEMTIVRFTVRSKMHVYNFSDVILNKGIQKSIRGSFSNVMKSGIQPVLGYVMETQNANSIDLKNIFDSFADNKYYEQFFANFNSNEAFLFFAWIEVTA